MKKAVKSHLESKWSICSFLLSGSLLTLVGELNLPSHFYSYNLLGSFAPSLYLGFILLGIALVLALQSEGDNYALSLLSLAVLFLVLYAIPYILAGSEVWNAYNFLGQDASIVRQGRLSPNLFPFEYYPASFVFYSEFIAISGISSASVVLGIFQVGWQVLFGLMIFVITKVLSGSRKTSIFSAWIFLLADYLDLAALWDQAYGFFLVLFGLLVVFLIMRRSGSRYSLVASLALITLAASHILSALFVLLLFIVLSIRTNQFRKLSVIGTLAFGAWSAEYAVPFLTDLSRTFSLTASHFFKTLHNSILVKLQPSATSASHILAANTEITVTAVYFLFASFGFLLMHRKKLYFNYHGIEIARILDLIILCSVIVYLIMLTNEGTESIERLYFLNLLAISVLISMFTVKAGRKISVPLLIFLIIVAPINLYSQYHNQPANYVSESQLDGSRFLATYCDGVSYGSLAIGFYLFASPDSVCSAQMYLQPLTRGSLQLLDANSPPQYLSLTSFDVGTFIYSFGENMSEIAYLETQMNDDPQLSLVYSSSTVLLYAHL